MKTSGAMPAGMKVEDFVQTIQDGMADDTWRRFAAAVAKRHEAMERQWAIEGKAKTRGSRRELE